MIEFIELSGHRFEEAERILAENDLPKGKFADRSKAFGLSSNGELIAVGAIDVCERAGLLRSVAISKKHRRKGLGTWFVAQIETAALDFELDELFLLTETAESFFENIGFEAIGKTDVPNCVRQSDQFSGCCAETAVAMKKNLRRMKRVLFVCIENSNRSQMAEAFANMHGKGRIKSFSSGSRPSGKVNQKAVSAMAELGYDLSLHRSKSLEEMQKYAPFACVVTMGCGDACPWMASDATEDWQIPDPRDMEERDFRSVRDLIEIKVKELIEKLDRNAVTAHNRIA